MVLGIRMTHGGPHRGSVLPHIAGLRSRGGMKLGQTRPGWKDVLNILCLFMALIILVLLLIYVPGRRPLQTLSLIVMGIGLLIESDRRYRNRSLVHSVAILVRPWPLRLGENGAVSFTSKLRNASVRAKLLCIEETKHSKGRDETVKHATRFELDIDTASDPWTLFIPANGLPSLAVRSNRIQWLVRVMITTDNREIPADFEILIIPEIGP